MTRCPRCHATTIVTAEYVLCASWGCPWFLTRADNQEHFRG